MNSRRRMQVYRTSHVLHWMSAAVCLAGLLLFSVTGITLNHASKISGDPAVTKREAQLPAPLMGLVTGADTPAGIPAPLEDWLESEFDLATGNASAEWSEEELYISAPGPGRDAWVSVDRATGAVKFEGTNRGWMAYFNDLHKGRNTGVVWVIFIDVLAAACLFFSITGLILLQIQARQRKTTWPLIGGGVFIVVALMIFFVH